jgi:ubiquinone/menaquinone biosynthesis C-methylase UbiE
MSWTNDTSNRSVFFDLLSPRQGDVVLDVGSGQGKVASLVQSTFSCEVHALDPNKKRASKAAKDHPGLKTCLAPSESVPYADSFFDKVYSTMAVHHFSDRRASLEEMVRVLKPVGTLLLVDVSPSSRVGKLCAFWENAVLRSHLSFLSMEDLSATLSRVPGLTVTDRVLRGQVYFVKGTKGAPPTDPSQASLR